MTSWLTCTAHPMTTRRERKNFEKKRARENAKDKTRNLRKGGTTRRARSKYWHRG